MSSASNDGAKKRDQGEKKRPSARRTRRTGGSPVSKGQPKVVPTEKRPSARRGATKKKPNTEDAAKETTASKAAPKKRASARAGASETRAAETARTPERTTPSTRPSARRSRPPKPDAAALSAAPSASRVVGEAPQPSTRPRDPIHELEEQVDRLIAEADSIAGDPHARRRAAEALTELAARLGGYDNVPPAPPEAGLIGGARELLSTDFYVRHWGRIGMRNRSEEVDDFGLDRTYEARVVPFFEALYRRWFRATVRGISRVPSEGRAMIVANHGGALPWDGPMIRTALRLEHPARREARWLTEDFVHHMPFLGAFLSRVGAVRANPQNAERLLAQEEVIAVFPEGIKGLGKLYRERYQLQRFGRGGYIKLALRTGTPIVPAGIAGSDEVYPLLMKSSRLAKLAGLPFLPVTPTFPWLGPLGLVPLPSRWVMVFGEPIDLSHHGPEAADDALLVSRLNDEVRARVQELVIEALGSRDSVF